MAWSEMLPTVEGGRKLPSGTGAHALGIVPTTSLLTAAHRAAMSSVVSHSHIFSTPSLSIFGLGL